MPTVLETAKEATYAAIGLNVLLVDELSERFESQRNQVEEQMNERFADQRSQIEEQLELAREHGQKARDRMQPLAKRSWELYESTMTRVSEIAPAPIDGLITDGVSRVRDLVGDDIAGPAEKPAKAAKKAPARKPAAKKAAAKK